MVDVKYSTGIWRRMIDLFQSQKYWMDGIAADFDITVQMAKALQEIPSGGTITMKELATSMWCDASNVTGIVDRLETQGYVARRPSDNDRRVKCVALTAAGKRLRRKLDDRLAQSPPALAELSIADQHDLAAILDRALANAQRRQSAEIA